MTLILIATGLSGLLTTRVLLAMGINNIVIRYPLAVLFSYLMFFLLIKLWLKYISTLPSGKPVGKNNLVSDALSNIDIPLDGAIRIPSHSIGSGFSGGSGEFSGAGASANFDDAAGAIIEGPASTVSETGGDVVGNIAEGAASALGDEGGVAAIVVMAVIGAVVAIVIGAGVYMVYEAPLILSEAAFEVVLATSLIKRTRAMHDPDWIGSVFRTTWKPFGISVVVAFVGALVIHHYYPKISRLSELLRQFLW
jgi:hypothetical protein